MTTKPNPYETLGVSRSATQQEIKASYRQLVKRFHPDSNCDTANHEEIIRINAAYEILKDRQRRQDYDQNYHGAKQRDNYRQERTVYAQNQYRQQKQTERDTDEHFHDWVKQVYRPVRQSIQQILSALDDEIERLSADPFDDELMADFQAYLNSSRRLFNQAQKHFRSMPNPKSVAAIAANLYYALNQVGDGIEELEFFTLNYDEHCLHTGHELMRIAADLCADAQAAIRQLFR